MQKNQPIFRALDMKIQPRKENVRKSPIQIRHLTLNIAYNPQQLKIASKYMHLSSGANMKTGE